MGWTRANDRPGHPQETRQVDPAAGTFLEDTHDSVPRGTEGREGGWVLHGQNNVFLQAGCFQAPGAGGPVCNACGASKSEDELPGANPGRWTHSSCAWEHLPALDGGSCMSVRSQLRCHLAREASRNFSTKTEDCLNTCSNTETGGRWGGGLGIP